MKSAEEIKKAVGILINAVKRNPRGSIASVLPISQIGVLEWVLSTGSNVEKAFANLLTDLEANDKLGGE